MFEPMYKPLAYGCKIASKYIRDRKSGELQSANTGIPSLNSALLDGIEWNTINTICAGSSAGKSTLSDNIQDSILNDDPKVKSLFFSLDMSISATILRNVSAITGLSQKTIKSAKGHRMTTEEEVLVSETLKSLANRPIFYIDKAPTVQEFKENILYFVAEQEMVENKEKLLVTVDFVTLMKESRYGGTKVVLDDLCAAVVELKKELEEIGVPTIFTLLSQSNRTSLSADTITNPKLHAPDPSWIMGSSSIMSASDNLMYLVNPSRIKGIATYTHANLPLHQALTGFPYIYLHFLKARSGELLNLQLVANFKKYKIYDAMPYA